jgi:hypothetical protein
MNLKCGQKLFEEVLVGTPAWMRRALMLLSRPLRLAADSHLSALCFTVCGIDGGPWPARHGAADVSEVYDTFELSFHLS